MEKDPLLFATISENPVDKTFYLNAAQAHLLAADRLVPTHPKHNLVAGKAFFTSDGDPRPLSEFCGKLWTGVTGHPLQPKSEPSHEKTTLLMINYLLDFFSPLGGGECLASSSHSLLMQRSGLISV